MSRETITSAANPAVKRLRSLNIRKYREEEGLFLVEGARHARDALRAGFALDTLACSARAAQDPLLAEIREGLRLDVSDDLLSRITGRDNAQALVAAFRQRWEGLEEVRAGLWVGLEGVRDPGNLGTVIRTCDAVAAQGVILIGETCDPWSPEAVRATVGSFARVRIARAGREDFLRWRQGWRGKVVGTHLRTPQDYRGAGYGLPLLLLMGGEQSGLSAELAQACDSLVKIPMPGGAESLNLAVSAGLMLYEILREGI